MQNGNIGALTGMSPGFMFIVALAVCALAVLYYVGLWMTLQKMGRHDFAAFIPGYDAWELARGTGMQSGPAAGVAIVTALTVFAQWHMRSVFLEQWLQAMSSNGQSGRTYGALANVLSTLPDTFAERIVQGDLLLGCAYIMPFVYLVVQAYLLQGVSRSFGHSVGYTIGLLLLPGVFFALLGCSRTVRYEGPLRDASYRANRRDDWADVVKSRMDTFGSNAPLAFAIIGMGMGAFFLTLPGVALCIVALVRNGAEKAKPLAKSKCRVTTAVALAGIVISIGVLIAASMLGVSLQHASIMAMGRVS